MIYALVEPSIYMIASILPTTRHPYRRVCREVRQAAQLRSANSNGNPEISSSLSQPADLQCYNQPRLGEGWQVLRKVLSFVGVTNSS
jgi:hypothetical protein